MGGDWQFEIRLPGGDTVKAPARAMYQLFHTHGKTTKVELYLDGDSRPLPDLLEQIPQLVNQSSIAFNDAHQQQLDAWKAVPEEDRRSLNDQSIDLLPGQDRCRVLLTVYTHTGKGWFAKTVVTATDNALEELHRERAMKECRQPKLAIATGSEWSRSRFSPDGRRLHVATSNGKLLAFDTGSGEAIYAAEIPNLPDSGPLGSPNHIVISGNGAVVGVGYKGTAIMCNAANGAVVRRTRSAEGGYCVAIAPDFSTCVFVGENGAQELDVRSGAIRRVLPVPRRGVASVAYSPDARVIGISEKHSGIGKYYRSGETNAFQTLTPQGFGSPRIESQHLLKDGSTVLGFGLLSRGLSIWDLGTGELSRSFRPRGHGIVALSPDESIVAAAATSHHDYQSVGVHDFGTGRRLDELGGFEAPLHALAFSPDGKALAANLKGGRILIWDLPAASTDRP